MKFILLDLDCSYFTRPEDLEGSYGDLLDLLPIHLGIVPFHRDEGVYVPEGADPGQTYPVQDNPDLVAYLRSRISRGQARVFLHGFDHFRHGRGEFSGGEGLRRRLIRGRAALEDCFGVPVRFFLPPNGGLCGEAMSALRSLGMHAIGRFSFDPRRGERDYLPESLWNWARRQIFLRRHPDLPFPWALRSHGRAELDCLWLMPGDTEQKLAGVAEALRSTGGTFILATHYWELARHPGLREALGGFLRTLAARADTRFPSLEEAVSIPCGPPLRPGRPPAGSSTDGLPPRPSA